MFREKENKVFVVISVLLFMLFFLTLLSGRVFRKQITELKRANSISDSNTVEVAWEDLYPYDMFVKTENTATVTQENDSSWVGKVTNVLDKVGKVGDTSSKLIYKYNEISQIGYVISSRLTDPSFGSNHIKLKNGYWVSATTSELEFSQAQEDVGNYGCLQKYLNEKGIDFLYCYTPTKECALDNKLPDGVTSYANVNIDLYIKALKSYDVNYIDLRAKLHESALEHYSLFYKTDHHWNVDAGMWAASVIEKEINECFGFSLKDVYDFGEYSRKTYSKAMFGSAGQAVTHFNEQSEDFDFLFPNFATQFRLEIPDKNIDEIGSFQEIFIDYDGLNSMLEEGGGYAYEQILYGNRPYEKITNLKNPNGPKILIIRDSFASIVAPYMALSCSEILLIDTRASNGNFTGSIVNCIKSFEPDIVLALQSGPQKIVLNK